MHKATSPPLHNRASLFLPNQRPSTSLARPSSGTGPWTINLTGAACCLALRAWDREVSPFASLAAGLALSAATGSVPRFRGLRGACCACSGSAPRLQRSLEPPEPSQVRPRARRPTRVKRLAASLRLAQPGRPPHDAVLKGRRHPAKRSSVYAGDAVRYPLPGPYF